MSEEIKEKIVSQEVIERAIAIVIELHLEAFKELERLDREGSQKEALSEV